MHVTPENFLVTHNIMLTTAILSSLGFRSDGRQSRCSQVKVKPTGVSAVCKYTCQ